MSAPVSRTWQVLDFGQDALSWYQSMTGPAGLFSSSTIQKQQEKFIINDGDSVQSFEVASGVVTLRSAKRGWSWQTNDRPSAVFTHPHAAPRKRLRTKAANAPQRLKNASGESGVASPSGHCQELQDAAKMVISPVPLAVNSPVTLAPSVACSIYDFQANLGEGTFGTVWSASVRGHPQDCVALKVAKGLPLGQAESIAQLSEEFQFMVSFVGEPAVAQVKQLFFGLAPRFEASMVMELCQSSLRQALDQVAFDPQNPGERCKACLGMPSSEAACQIVKGIAKLHASQLLHRDLKPGNVLVRFRSSPAQLLCISDFGSAMLSRDAVNECKLLQHVGTGLLNCLLEAMPLLEATCGPVV